MPITRAHRLSLLLAVHSFAFLADAALAQVRPREDENFSNAAFVRVDDEAKADLFSADQAAAAKDWAVALERYQRLLDSTEPAIVEFGPRTWLAAPAAAMRRVSALPQEGHARYGELFGARASAAFEDERRTHDPQGLLRVAWRYPTTDGARRALQVAVQLAAERRDAPTLDRAIAALADGGSLRAEDAARALATFAALRNAPRFRALVTRIASAEATGGSLKTEAPLLQAGVATTLRDFIASLESELTAARVASEAATAALARGPLQGPPIGAQSRTEKYLAEGMSGEVDYDPRRRLQLDPPPVSFAGRFGESIAVTGRQGVYLHPAGGPPAIAAPAFRYEQLFGDPNPVFDLTSRGLEPAFGAERLFLAIERATGNDSDRHAVRSVLFSLTPPASPGPPRLAWRYDGPPTADEALDHFVFEGPPVIAGDLVLISASRLEALSECALFAFDRDTGALRYCRFLASAADIADYDMRLQSTDARRVRPSPVVVDGGTAYVATNLGIVAAVDAATGAIDWLFKYNRMSPTDRDRFEESALNDDGGWRPAPPATVGDKLVVTPEDSRFLYVLAREPSPEGNIILNEPIFKLDCVSLLAVDAARAALVFHARWAYGQDGDKLYIKATDFDGTERWKTHAFEDDEQIAGRVAIVSDVLFLPTTRRILRIDLVRDGLQMDYLLPPRELIQRGERHFFGNLTLESGLLLSASPEFTIAIRPRE